ncbi:dicarboxylate/amino acid:cation symporter [Hathewaya histolytica]|uniref:dicarboxylate/amino acid:cation symporter n=1 Tax=Hathewaya histolytica TaxID=1498 RepID=UPI003B675DD0
MKKIFNSLIFKLLISVAIGIILGLIVNTEIITIIVTFKHILGQVIFFMVPLIIIAFIAPSIASLKINASKLLGTTVLICYLSSIGAAFLSMTLGYSIIPKLSINNNIEGLKELPKLLFKLDIPPIMSVMSALVLALILGLGTSWTRSERIEKLLNDFQNIMLSVVNRIVIPILPIFIATTFASLSYEGSITKQLPVFINVLLIVIVAHYIWLAFLYSIGALISKKNPLDVIKHYGGAYLAAFGTMSSSAALPMALKSAKKSPVLRDDIVDFSIPLCSTTHLCGSVLTEVFLVMTVSQVVYGKLPSLSTMILFVILLGIFAIGAPGVPGGTVMASLGLLTSVIGFNDSAAALVLTIFALQDSFGTSCNITGDGAISLMLTGIVERKDSFKNSSSKEKISS